MSLRLRQRSLNKTGEGIGQGNITNTVTGAGRRGKRLARQREPQGHNARKETLPLKMTPLSFTPPNQAKTLGFKANPVRLISSLAGSSQLNVQLPTSGKGLWVKTKKSNNRSIQKRGSQVNIDCVTLTSGIQFSSGRKESGSGFTSTNLHVTRHK